MRGKLKKVFEKWFVKYEVYSTGYGESGIVRAILPLHPEDYAMFDISGKLPDDNHIMDNRECEFEIIELEEDQTPVGDIIYRDYAKLIINTVYFNPVGIVTNDSNVKILIDALNDIANWDDDLEEEWGDCGLRAKHALKEFNNK